MKIQRVNRSIFCFMIVFCAGSKLHYFFGPKAIRTKKANLECTDLLLSLFCKKQQIRMAEHFTNAFSDRN